MDSRLYNKTVTCPVCALKFEATRVKANGCKIASRDTDFCVYYEDINPIFYDVWVCDNCGYAAQSDKFEEISQRDAVTIREKIASRWAKRSFAGERNVDAALEAFKLALYNLNIRKAKSNELARVCIRIAWMYRLKKDPKEKEFLQYAMNFYTQTYEKETLPVEKLDEFTCMYMIAELNRRVGSAEESIKWFSRLISSPEARKNASLVEMARDQFQLVKDQQKKSEGQPG